MPCGMRIPKIFLSPLVFELKGMEDVKDAMGKTPFWGLGSIMRAKKGPR